MSPQSVLAVVAPKSFSIARLKPDYEKSNMTKRDFCHVEPN